MKPRRRLAPADYLRFTLPRVLTAALMAVLLGAFGWYVTTGTERVRDKCNRAYARSRNAADSAEVDRTWLGGRFHRETTCGSMRRAGYLDPPGRPS